MFPSFKNLGPSSVHWAPKEVSGTTRPGGGWAIRRPWQAVPRAQDGDGEPVFDGAWRKLRMVAICTGHNLCSALGKGSWQGQGHRPRWHGTATRGIFRLLTATSAVPPVSLPVCWSWLANRPNPLKGEVVARVGLRVSFHVEMQLRVSQLQKPGAVLGPFRGKDLGAVSTRLVPLVKSGR